MRIVNASLPHSTIYNYIGGNSPFEMSQQLSSDVFDGLSDNNLSQVFVLSSLLLFHSLLVQGLLKH